MGNDNSSLAGHADKPKVGLSGGRKSSFKNRHSADKDVKFDKSRHMKDKDGRICRQSVDKTGKKGPKNVPNKHLDNNEHHQLELQLQAIAKSKNPNDDRLIEGGVANCKPEIPLSHTNDPPKDAPLPTLENPPGTKGVEANPSQEPGKELIAKEIGKDITKKPNDENNPSAVQVPTGTLQRRGSDHNLEVLPSQGPATPQVDPKGKKPEDAKSIEMKDVPDVSRDSVNTPSQCSSSAFPEATQILDEARVAEKRYIVPKPADTEVAAKKPAVSKLMPKPKSPSHKKKTSRLIFRFSKKPGKQSK